MKTKFFVGCAGWSILAQHAHAFPQDGTHLQRYSAVFNAVEINSSFYRPHRRETYARWAASVPASFRFSVKLPKEITHTLRLRRSARSLESFFEQIKGLGWRLGAVLIQLPPSLVFERPIAKRFLTQVRDRFRGLVVLEPRHRSWFAPAVDTLLRDAGISRVAADPAVTEAGGKPGGALHAAYFRLHGAPRIYYSEYETQVLDSIAAQMRQCRNQAWCIFDNTAIGFSISNALSLRQRLSRARDDRRTND